MRSPMSSRRPSVPSRVAGDVPRRFDEAIGGGYTQAILYVDAGVLNTIDVFAVDGAGNKSAPASVMVDMRQ